MPSPNRLAPLQEPGSPSSDRTCYEADSETSEPESPSIGRDDSRPPFGRLSHLWNYYLVHTPRQLRRSRDLSPVDLSSSPYNRCSSPRISRRRYRFTPRHVLFLVGAYLIVLGIFHLFENLNGFLTPFRPDDSQWALHHWGTGDDPTKLFAHRRGVVGVQAPPVACHSHNDYKQTLPLISAMTAGCTSVETDVWLFEEEIYVGHSKSELTAQRTLRSLYLDPLLEMLDAQNKEIRDPKENRVGTAGSFKGVFDADPTQSLVLLIDFKTSDQALWDKLHAQLQPLRTRGYLTHFNGTSRIDRAVTVIASGAAPWKAVAATQSYRDIFYDAPLEQLASSQNQVRVGSSSESDGIEVSPYLISSVYDTNNSVYSSASLEKSVGRVWWGGMSDGQIQLVRSQVQEAHGLGLKVRYWGLPQFPSGLRNNVWRTLVWEGVDVLDVDDLSAATRRDWRMCKGRRC